MEFNKQLLQYLKGEKFSNSLIINLGREKHEDRTRENAIIDLIKDLNVLHIGCSDHIPVIREKLAVNKWLHKLLTDNSKVCLGIDIDKESIDFVKQELNFKNVIYGDIISGDINEIIKAQWDFVVFGEIIEHLDNPVYFLQRFKERYSKCVKKFIITVPNIYCKNSFKNMLKYNETINSDHRFWFTPYTISKILIMADLTPEKIIYSNLINIGNTGFLLRRIKRFLKIPVKYPFYFFKTIIITGNIN